MKQIERKINRTRNALIKRGKVLFRNAIKQQYYQAIAIIKTANLDDIADKIRFAVTPDAIEKSFIAYYSSASVFSMLWRDELLKKKSVKDDLYKAKFQRSMVNYAKEKCRKRLEDITKTTENFLIDAVESAVTESVTRGLGIEATRGLIVDFVAEQYKNISQSRARMIAQTEMITASNQAAMEAGKSTGLEFRKFWSTSGLENTRETHIGCEQESLDRNGLKEDETFQTNGLLFPGDPSGPPEEVINCRCSILLEIV